MTAASAGHASAPRGPAAVTRPSSITTAASGTGAAPVPSIRVAPVRTRIIGARAGGRSFANGGGHRLGLRPRQAHRLARVEQLAPRTGVQRDPVAPALGAREPLRIARDQDRLRRL